MPYPKPNQKNSLRLRLARPSPRRAGCSSPTVPHPSSEEILHSAATAPLGEGFPEKLVHPSYVLGRGDVRHVLPGRDVGPQLLKVGPGAVDGACPVVVVVENDFDDEDV